MKEPKMPDFPAQPPPPAPLGMVQGNKPGKRPMTPTVLGSGALPGAAGEAGSQRGGATLLGQ